MQRHPVFISGIAVAMLLLMAPAEAADYSASLSAGYNGGPGATLSGAIVNFASGFPMGLTLGVGYTAVAPGNAADARRIFINDATNGTPSKDGWRWDLRFDLTYQMPMGSFNEFFLSAGPRYTFHTSNFNFVGGNENFDVTSKQWGLGLGAGGAFPMGSKADFVLSGGADYYFEGSLQGHDTAYSPDGEHVNSRADYTFSDAQEAINQPNVIFRLMMGVSYYFGR
jgi:hypothetical protein